VLCVKLVIFDLDQTLVDLFRVHDRVYHKTMAEIFGVKACYKNLDHAGKRIPDLIAEYARREGVTPQVIAMNIEEAERAYELHFLSEVKNVKKHVLPGALQLLEALSKKHKLALVTGSTCAITARVLRESGLNRHFPVVSCADFAPTRAELVKRAIKKAGRVEEVWVIGDSARDIEAGKANGAKTIGVLTGGHDKKTLAAAKPAYIFKDLTPLRRILEVIG
jgi:HAD superfamily hydrolase (TIGR01509 family)